jgi:colanic acid biosynthesis glycosyl transferase WcaI
VAAGRSHDGRDTSPDREGTEGIVVVRCGGGEHGSSLARRALAQAFLLPRLLLRVLSLPRHDVVVTMTDPPMLFLLGPLIRRLKGSRLIHWAHDLYPDVAAASGLIDAKGVPFHVLRTLSLAALRRHDRVVAVGECMRERLESSGIPPSLLLTAPNVWAGDGIRPVSRHSAWRRTRGLSGKFTVMYSGNFGRAHDFQTILDAAGLLEARREDNVLFLLSGDGPKAGFLRGEVSRLGLANVRFLQRVPEEELSESMGAGDLHLVTMSPEMCGLVVPSKFYGVAASGRPCIFVGPLGSEIAREITTRGLGLRVAPGDARALSEAILRFRDQTHLYEATSLSISSYRQTFSEYPRPGGFQDLPGIAEELLASPRS